MAYRAIKHRCDGTNPVAKRMALWRCQHAVHIRLAFEFDGDLTCDRWRIVFQAAGPERTRAAHSGQAGEGRHQLPVDGSGKLLFKPRSNLTGPECATHHHHLILRPTPARSWPSLPPSSSATPYRVRICPASSPSPFSFHQ